MEKIETERLILRRFCHADWADLYEYMSDSQVVRYEKCSPFTREQAQMAAARRTEDEKFWAVCLPTGKMIGNLYFACHTFAMWELGYVFHRAYQGKGYAGESAGALLTYGFETMGVRRVTAQCNPLNTRSWQLLERLHFRREGHFIADNFWQKDGVGCPIWEDTYSYALLKSEWLRLRAEQPPLADTPGCLSM